MGIVRDSRNFSGHPYIGHIARSSLRQLSFLVLLSADSARVSIVQSEGSRVLTYLKHLASKFAEYCGICFLGAKLAWWRHNVVTVIWWSFIQNVNELRVKQLKYQQQWK